VPSAKIDTNACAAHDDDRPVEMCSGRKWELLSNCQYEIEFCFH
jgi:hypothetical protein